MNIKSFIYTFFICLLFGWVTAVIVVGPTVKEEILCENKLIDFAEEGEKEENEKKEKEYEEDDLFLLHVELSDDTSNDLSSGSLFKLPKFNIYTQVVSPPPEIVA